MRNALTLIRPSAWLKRAPHYAAPVETEILYGSLLQKLGEDGIWYHVRLCSRLTGATNPVHGGYEGYVLASACGVGYEAPSHVISALSAPIFRRADIKSSLRYRLSMGSQLKVLAVKGEFLQINPQGFVHAAHVKRVTDLPSGEDYVSIAQAHMGRPYIWGGVGTDGLDCSGLVQSCLYMTGHEAPRDTRLQSQYLGRPIDASKTLNTQKGRKTPESLKRGDFIFWPGHVGIMTDQKNMIHANAYHMAVATEPLAHAIKRIGDVSEKRRLDENLIRQ